MKTISRYSAATFAATLFLCAFCTRANAGGLLTSPDPEETQTPPPIVEQATPAPASDKKVDEKTTTSDDTTKDSDSKAKKTAKKKKQKEPKPEAAAAPDGDKKDGSDDTKSDVTKTGKSDDQKNNKADRKKSGKSDAKTATEKDADKDADTKKTDVSNDKDAGNKKDATESATTEDGTPKAKSTVPMPTRVASFSCGAIFGFPFAMAKRTVHQTRAGRRDFVGDTKNPIALGLATLVSIPFGVMGGVFEGVEYSVMNSWKGSKDEPFGKDSFSRGDFE